MTNRVYSVFVPLILAFSVSAVLITAQQAALDAAQRQQVIQAVIANLKQHYAWINEDFGMGIPTTKPINPYSEPDWVAVGVEPDIKVKSTDALASAEKLLKQKLRAK